MQQNGEVDGFFSIVSPPVTSPSLVLIVDSRNGNRFLQGSEASERVTHAGLRVVSLDHPKLSRPVTLRWKTCENYLGHEVAGLLAFGAKAFQVEPRTYPDCPRMKQQMEHWREEGPFNAEERKMRRDSGSNWRQDFRINDAQQLNPFKLALVKTELEICVGRRLLSRV